MFTNGSAINNSWSDTTLVDNLRAADITRHPHAASGWHIHSGVELLQ